MRHSRSDEDRVVILGAGPAGLLAALELARRPSIGSIRILDRHGLRHDSGRARGPRHEFFPHLVLGLGIDNLRAIAPGLLDSLQRRGRAWSLPWDDRHVEFYGGTRRAIGPAHASVHTVLFRRTDLQHALMARAQAHPKITMSGGIRLLDVEFDRRARASSITVAPQGQPVRTIGCDLLIDAMGRASRWATVVEDRLKVEVPREEVQSQAYYVCQHFGDASSAVPRFRYRKLHPRARLRGLLAHTLPDGWIANAIGIEPDLPEPYGRPHGIPPRTNDELLEFLAAEDPELSELLSTLTPSHERPRQWRKLSSRVYRYDEVARRLPPNTASVGDALRSLNPAYGTGLTLTTLDALNLGQTYDEVGAGESFARHFVTRASRESLMATGFAYLDDLALPGTSVRRNGVRVAPHQLRPWLRAHPLLHRAIGAMLERTTYDPASTERVFGLLHQPLRPRSWWSLAWSHRPRRHAKRSRPSAVSRPSAGLDVRP